MNFDTLTTIPLQNLIQKHSSALTPATVLSSHPQKPELHQSTLNNRSESFTDKATQ